MAAVGRRDGAEVMKLAGEPSFQDLPLASVVICARDLAQGKEWGSSAQNLSAAKEWGAAEVLLRAGLERNPGDFWLNHDLGQVLLEQQPPRAGEAVRYLTAALALRPDSPGVHLNLGVALKENGDLEGAILRYRAALHIDRNYAMAHLNLGDALTSKGQLEEAIAESHEAIRLQKDLPAAHYNLGNALQLKGQLDAAIAEYHEALRLKKDFPEASKAHYSLGNALKAKGDLEGAIRAYRAAIEYNPKLAEAHCNLGAALWEKGDVDGAIREYRAAIEYNPKLAEGHYGLGLLLLGKGDVDGAIREFRAALPINPKDAEAHYSLGIALGRKGDLEGAIRAYRAAIEHNPQSAEAHCNLGYALRDQGRFREALEALRTGHALGSKKANWNYPSAQWVSDVERLVELDGKLPAILQVKARPKDPAEQIDLADLCARYRGLTATAARLYAEGFAAQPTLAEDVRAGHRYNAACAAALAAGGQGKDADKLEDRERARLRRQALTWLRADLAAWRKQWEVDEAKWRPVVRQTMQHWLADTDLAGVRGLDALARLPEAERRDWQQLWADVQDLSAKAGEKSSRQEK
jgi:tetratricopeptide (TPR) repeat protein